MKANLLKDTLHDRRNSFFAQQGGYDTHADNNALISENFQALDAALSGFVTEMKAQKLWENVTVVMLTGISMNNKK